MGERCERQCPLHVMFEVGEELVHAAPESHQDTASALGLIAMTRDAFERTRAKLQDACPDPTVNQNGYLVCPLQDATYGARALSQIKPQQPFHTPLKDFAPTDPVQDRGHGQYL